MKMTYEKPLMEVQRFMANEFCSACGDSGKVYNFECNARGGKLYYYPESDGKLDGIYTGTGEHKALGLYYHPCDKTHQASAASDFYEGFVDYNFNGQCDDDERVIIWRGDSGKNGHATKNLDVKNWETAKS